MKKDDGKNPIARDSDGLTEERWQFADDEEYIIYTKLYGEGKKIVREDPSEYYTLCELGEQLARTGKLDEAAEVYGRALDVNPIAIVAMRNYADCIIRQGMPDIGEKILRLMGRHIVDEAVLWLYYLDWSNVELYNKNVLAAAACMYYATFFNKRGKRVHKTVDVNQSLEKLASVYDIDLEYVKANVMPILAEAGVPLYSQVDILRRNIRLGITNFYERDDFVAIIDGKTREVITDKARFDDYADDDLIACEFLYLAEARAFAATAARGRNIALVRPTEYKMMLEEAYLYMSHGNYKDAAQILADSFYLNPVGMKAELGLIPSLISINEYDAANLQLTRMFPYIIDDELANRFYELFGYLEHKRGNYNNMAACTVMALKFGDSETLRELTDIAKTELGTAYDEIAADPVQTLCDAGIPLITAELLKQRNEEYGIKIEN